MATLTDSEVEKLFSGAPQYFARSEGPNTGAPNPSVAFPWDETLDIRDLTDHAQIEDEAWGCVTALPHITRSARRQQQKQQKQQLKQQQKQPEKPSTSTTTTTVSGSDNASNACSSGAAAAPAEKQKRRAHFYPKCRERPNMLSMQGLEKGTVGYSAALELSVSDSLQEEQFGFDSLGRKATAVVEARQKLLTTKDPGLRYLEEATVMEQLIKNEKRYMENNIRDDTRSTDLYNELFLKLLHPPTRVLDHADPYSLSVQIQALLKVLNAPNVWIDFSRVEWRNRLVQILWGTPPSTTTANTSTTSAAASTPSSPTTATPAGGNPATATAAAEVEAGEDIIEDGASIRGAESTEARHEERYWLLMQILLACELWIRLDAITEADEAGVEQIKPREIYRFQQDATPSVKWSMLLARCWLENVEVIKTEPGQAAKEQQSQQQHHEPSHGHSSWLATLTKRISGSGSSSSTDHHHGHGHHHGAANDPHPPQPTYTMRGRHGQRQVEGLTHFARRLRWPEIEAHEAQVAQNVLRAAAEGTPLNSPLASPLSGDGRRGSYFGASPRSPTASSAAAAVAAAAKAPVQETANHRPVIKGKHIALNIHMQHAPRRRKISAMLHQSGWLSKSYVSGLMLPGEGIGHFLMAALLENDADAMTRLGPVANLSGGFVYCGKSFWSTACVVGRVIAAAKGSVECMGWISSDITPQGLGDGWVDIEVEQVPVDAIHTGKQARIWGKLAIERESSVLGNGDPDSVFPADFIIPFENLYSKDAPPPPSCSIELQSLKLFAPVDSVHTTPTEEILPVLPPIGIGIPISGSKTPTPINTSLCPSPVLTRSPPEIHTYPAAVTFTVIHYKDEDAMDEDDMEFEAKREDFTFCLSNDIYFATAHPCVPSQHVKILKSPSSPTIREIDTSANSGNVPGKQASNSTTKITSHPLHKYYDYTAIHLTELLARRDATLDQLLVATTSNTSSSPQQNRPPSSSSSAQKTPTSPSMSSKSAAQALPHSRHSSTGSTRSVGSSTSSGSGRRAPRVLVIDCITGFQPLPQEHEIPLSPVVSRSSTYSHLSQNNNGAPQTPDGSSGGAAGGMMSSSFSSAAGLLADGANQQMHNETRRRQFGSDMEVLVRALCAEKGWNALVSRRRRGCLACAIREAGALGWKVIIRVD